MAGMGAMGGFKDMGGGSGMGGGRRLSPRGDSSFGRRR